MRVYVCLYPEHNRRCPEKIQLPSAKHVDVARAERDGVLPPELVADLVIFDELFALLRLSFLLGKTGACFLPLRAALRLNEWMV